jgi:hypothetical protein
MQVEAFVPLPVNTQKKNNGSGAVKVSKLDAWELAPAKVNLPGNGLITAASSMHLREAY